MKKTYCAKNETIKKRDNARMHTRTSTFTHKYSRTDTHIHTDAHIRVNNIEQLTHEHAKYINIVLFLSCTITLFKNNL